MRKWHTQQYLSIGLMVILFWEFKQGFRKNSVSSSNGKFLSFRCRAGPRSSAKQCLGNMVTMIMAYNYWVSIEFNACWKAILQDCPGIATQNCVFHTGKLMWLSTRFSCSMLKTFAGVVSEMAPQTPGNPISYGFPSDLQVFNFQLTASVLRPRTIQGEQPD